MATYPSQPGVPPLEEKQGQAALYYANSQSAYFQPPPLQPLPNMEYGGPPVPPPYGNPAQMPTHQPHDSYFPEKQQYQYQQPQQSPWPVSGSGVHKVDSQGQAQYTPTYSQFPPTPESSWSSQASPASQFPPTPHYTPLPQYSPGVQYFSPPSVQYPPTPAITPGEDTFQAPRDGQKQAIEDQKSNWGKRFVSNTLVGRVVRASVQSAVSTATLPAYLSPWGDNNPITLPNLRKRDAALGLAGHFGIVGVDTIAPSALEFGSVIVDEVVKLGLSEAATQVVDEGIDHVKPKKPIKITRTAHAKTVQARIKHKLIGVDAELNFVGEYPAESLTAIDKGWFCPYLYASGRAPSLPRSKDFAIATLVNPSLRGQNPNCASIRARSC